MESFLEKDLHTLPTDENKTSDTSAIRIVESADVTLAYLHGRIDIDSSPAIRERLLALLRGSHTKTVSVDLSAVTHMDSSGVATLIEALRIARRYSTELRLQGLDVRLLRIFETSGILPLFNGRTQP